MLSVENFIQSAKLYMFASVISEMRDKSITKMYFLPNTVQSIISSFTCSSQKSNIFITKTWLPVYNFDPFQPHFYMVKLGFTWVFIIFLISAQNIDCGYSLEPPWWGSSNEYPQSMFWAEIWKKSFFFIWNFSVFGGEIFYIFEKVCLRNESSHCIHKYRIFYYMHNQEIPWFLPDIKLVFSLFSKKKYFLLAVEINLFNWNYFFFCNIWTA